MQDASGAGATIGLATTARALAMWFPNNAVELPGPEARAGGSVEEHFYICAGNTWSPESLSCFSARLLRRPPRVPGATGDLW